MFLLLSSGLSIRNVGTWASCQYTHGTWNLHILLRQVSTAVTKDCDQKKLEEERIYSLLELSGPSPSLKDIRGETQAGPCRNSLEKVPGRKAADWLVPHDFLRVI